MRLRAESQTLTATNSVSVAPLAPHPAGVFRRSMALSAVRCTLTYLIFPFVLPIAGISTGLDLGLGLFFGPVAIAANLYSIHRFWSVDHRFKKPVTAVHAAMVLALGALLVGDLNSVLS